MSPDGKNIQEMILDQVQENRQAIRALDLKFDEKVEDLHGRINVEIASAHKRINPIEREQAAQDEKQKRIASTCRWLIWAVSAIGLTILGALAGVLIGNGGGS